jgi:hypothetical protein
MLDPALCPVIVRTNGRDIKSRTGGKKLPRDSSRALPTRGPIVPQRISGAEQLAELTAQFDRNIL